MSASCHYELARAREWRSVEEGATSRHRSGHAPTCRADARISPSVPALPTPRTFPSDPPPSLSTLLCAPPHDPPAHPLRSHNGAGTTAPTYPQRGHCISLVAPCPCVPNSPLATTSICPHPPPPASASIGPPIPRCRTGTYAPHPLLATASIYVLRHTPYSLHLLLRSAPLPPTTAACTIRRSARPTRTTRHPALRAR